MCSLFNELCGFAGVQEQLKPLLDQLGRVKDLPPPDYGSLQAWEVLAGAAGRGANGDLNGDPSRSLNGFGGTPMPYLGETKVTFFKPFSNLLLS